MPHIAAACLLPAHIGIQGLRRGSANGNGQQYVVPGRGGASISNGFSMKLSVTGEKPAPAPEDYRLEDQVGFILRQASQRHTALFAAAMIEELTPTQWAALAKLHECGGCSQNHLGRLTAMDAATIKGVIDRLTRRGLTEAHADVTDARRLLVALTAEGEKLYARARPLADAITAETLAPLSLEERDMLVALLRRVT